MNKKMLIIGIAVLILTVGFSGCFDSGENPFIGTWELTEFQESFSIKIEYTFFENKKVLQILSVEVNQTRVNHTFVGEYESTNDFITISYENNLPKKKEKYSYVISNDSLTLSNRNVFPVQSTNLTRVSSEPLRDWPIADKQIEENPKSLVLTKEDLPEGYKICNNGTDEPGRIVDPIDSFSRAFAKENCTSFEDSLLSVIMTFSSSFDASIFYHETKMPVILYEIEKIIDGSVDSIGDNSFAHYLGEKLNSSQIYYWFRISNIVGLLKVPYDYEFAQNLAELVEQKIYDSRD